MDDEVIRIVVFTDSHLGFQEKDPVRGDDSFAAYEEAFHFAAKEKADFVLHAGDMFHENRPSRRTLHSAMTVLRKYCFGEAPVRIEVLNDQKEVFKQNGGVVNYESPYQSISLPVFAIHGNHDDISREAGSGATLSALDLMAVSNFVNYFGKSEQVDDILISPILIRKKGTNIALYGLGAMRDERLNRMWMQKKVRFSQPPNAADFFNILVLHQNRDYGRGRKNCIHESMIPEWMDLVIWGNEHECIPNLQESLVGTYRIYQPGSSVATSFSEGESRTHPKSIGLIQIKQKKFKLRVESFTQVRPFIYGEIKLSDFSPGQIQAASPKEEDQIKAVLKQKIESMIGEARGEAEKISSAAVQKKLTFRVKEPSLVLVRLRCDHAGFTSINPSRFGSTFVGKVANASDMVAFSKKTVHQGRAVEKAGGGAGGGGGGLGKMGTVAEQMKQALADGEEDAVHKIKIEDLVAETLTGKSKLQLIREEDMAQALEDYVARKNLSAITDAITAELENCQEKLLKNDALDNTTRDSIIEAAQNVVKGRAAGEKRAAAPKARPKALDEDEDEIVDDDDEGPGAGKKKPAAKRAPAAKKAPAAAKAPAKSRAKPKAKDDYEDGGRDQGDDFMDDEDDNPPAKGRGKKASAPTSSRKSGRAVKQKNYAADDDDDEDDEGSVEEVRGLDDEDEDEEEERAPPPRAKKPPAAAKPASKSAPPPKGKSSEVVDLCSDNEDIDEDDDDHPRTNQSKATMFSATSAVDDSGALAPSGPSQATKKRALPASLTGSSTAAKKKSATSKLSDWE